MARNRCFRNGLLLAAGMLAALPTSFSTFSFLACLSFVPALMLFFYEWQTQEVRARSYWLPGFCFLMGYFILTFHWFLSLWPLDFVEGISPASAVGVMAAACLGLPLLQSLGYMGLFVLLARLSRTRFVKACPLALPFLFAAGWTFFAFTQTLTWAGVPWGSNLALSQYENLYFVSSASLFGSYFVTFIIALCNGLLAETFLYLLQGARRQARTAALICAGVFCANVALSFLAFCWPMTDKEMLSAAVLQGNFSSAEKWESGTDPFSRYAPLAKEAAEAGATLIVWPETAFPYELMRDMWTVSRLRDLAKETGATHLIGTFSYETGSNGERARYNVFYLIRPDGSIGETTYKKRHLVPFGEYVPMEAIIRTCLPFLSDLEMLDDGSQVEAGTDPSLLKEDAWCIGGLICFDSIYPSLSRDSVRAGAEILALGTNDSWFFDSAAVYQHNGQAVLRAIETGRCVLRAANTGVSSIISEKGEILASIPPLVSGQVTAEVHTYTGQTLYTRMGDWFLWACGLFFHFPLVYDLWQKKRGR